MASTQLMVVTSASGNFTVAHNLGFQPTAVIIDVTSSGNIWFQPQLYDVNNLYLISSDAGVTATISVYADSSACAAPPALSSQVEFTSPAPGNFSVPHYLGSVPNSVVIQITNPGTVWFQPVPYDASNLNLVASDVGVTGYALSYSDLYAPLLF